MAKYKRPSQIRKKRARKEGGRYVAKIFRLLILAFLFVMISGALTAVGIYFYFSENLPKISSLKDYQPPVITTVYSDDNRKIGEFYQERRIVLPLDKMSTTLKEAFISAEDARFYKHKGIDILSIIRAFFKNIEAGTIVQGGSTITQQVTKSFFLTPEKAISVK